MFQIVQVFVVFVLIQGAFCRFAPSFIHPCSAITADCLKKMIQQSIPEYVKGIPTLGVGPTDPFPLEIDELEPQPGFKLSLKNGRLTGVRTCIVDSVKYENKLLDFNLHCNLTLKGKYKALGRVLIVSINGEGDAKVKASGRADAGLDCGGTNILLANAPEVIRERVRGQLTGTKSANLMVNAKIRFEDEVRDGVVYYVIKDAKVKHRFGDRVTYQLANLFKGSPEISNAVLAFLNENWKEVATELGSPLVDSAVKQVLKTVNQFFISIPKDELFPK